jgi:hypothetical protein
MRCACCLVFPRWSSKAAFNSSDEAAFAIFGIALISCCSALLQIFELFHIKVTQ